jgi:hypothetical protein
MLFSAFHFICDKRISANWARRCQQEAGAPLSKAVQAEFKKRISQGQAGSSKAKPKLNLANCELIDIQV